MLAIECGKHQHQLILAQYGALHLNSFDPKGYHLTVTFLPEILFDTGTIIGRCPVVTTVEIIKY
jgi:hypothetical protein